jgi:hypothetical protein
MKKLILLVSASALLCGCESFQTPSADTIKLEVRGTPGMKFSGTYSVDGKEKAVCGTVPMDIATTEGNFHSVFRKEGDGVLTVILNKEGKLYGEATSVTENGGVQARISPGESFDLTSVTGF